MQSGSGDRRKVEFQMSEEGRLPPGQSLTLKFPVLHYGPVPTFDLTEWDFRIWGEIENEGTWTWDEFQKLPKTKLKMDIHCVTRWSKFDAEWEGVSLHTLIDEGWLNLKPSALYVVQHCEYGFTANLPVTIALADNFLLATHYAGEPITPDHGFPLRGVVGAIPGRGELKDVYLWKGGKWLRGLEFLSEDKKGFWEQAGYHNEADIWKEERFD
ncbi:MAG: molybdopterin-dependent oxidoreductase [Anaerolineales bacterium]|jgi:DMSO/TMAO reductase YedYZ molybdopterin-dependent catalytic subunit